MQSTGRIYYHSQYDILVELFIWGRFIDLIEGETREDKVHWSGVWTCDDPSHFGWHYIGEV